MRKFIAEYVDLIGFGLLGLVFAYASFYLFLNVYHMSEVAVLYDIPMSQDIAYNKVLTKMETVKNNLVFNANSYKGSLSKQSLLSLQGRMEVCVEQFENDTFLSIADRKNISIKDVEMLRVAFQNEVANGCLVEQLYAFVGENSSRADIPSLVTIAPYVKLDIDSLLNSTSYMQKDFLNNSSYYFSTEQSRISVMNKTRDGYGEVMSYYNRAADTLVQLSDWFHKEVS